MNDTKKPPLSKPNPPKPMVTEPTSPAVVVEKRTVVEEGTRFKGSLRSTVPIIVHGSIEGDIDGTAVTVSGAGAISGKVAASAFKSEGKIAGELDVDTAELSGTVEKDTVLRATSLTLKLTASDGKLQLAFGGARRS